MSFVKKLKLDSLFDLRRILVVYILVTVTASLHKYLIGTINNYLIFKTSFFNLIAFNDLYTLFPQFHHDYYKYSPTFSLLMAPMAVLPDYLGLIVWNLVNTLPLYYAIKKLDLEDRKKALILWIVLVELVTSIQNCQSNGLYAAMFILTFVCLENKQSFWAALIVVLAFFVKIFGLAAAILFIFYPGRLRFLLYCVFWFVILALAPLLVVPFKHLIFLYSSWYDLLTRDVIKLHGLSVMGILKTWFGLKLSNPIAMLIGIVLLFLPLAKVRSYKDRYFRYLFLCSLLVWIVIFNHKAESPMFIIAVTGVALWYVLQSFGKIYKFLLFLTLVITSLSPTDIFPGYLRANFVQPYLLKVVPCILVWMVIEYQLLVGKNNKDQLVYKNIL